MCRRWLRLGRRHTGGPCSSRHTLRCAPRPCMCPRPPTHVVLLRFTLRSLTSWQGLIPGPLAGPRLLHTCACNGQQVRNMQQGRGGQHRTRAHGGKRAPSPLRQGFPLLACGSIDRRRGQSIPSPNACATQTSPPDWNEGGPDKRTQPRRHRQSLAQGCAFGPLTSEPASL